MGSRETSKMDAKRIALIIGLILFIVIMAFVVWIAFQPKCCACTHVEVRKGYTDGELWVIKGQEFPQVWHDYGRGEWDLRYEMGNGVEIVITRDDVWDLKDYANWRMAEDSCHDDIGQKCTSQMMDAWELIDCGQCWTCEGIEDDCDQQLWCRG